MTQSNNDPDDFQVEEEEDDAGFGDPSSDEDDDDGASAFGGKPSEDGDDDFDTYPVPPTPIGLLPGIVKTAKKVEITKDGTTKTSLVLGIQCTDPRFVASAPVDRWLELPRNIKEAAQICAALGLPIRHQAGTISLPKPPKFVNKAGLWLFGTYVDASGTEVPKMLGWIPKPEASPAFTEWLADAGLTDAQLKIVKASPGVVPLNALD